MTTVCVAGYDIVLVRDRPGSLLQPRDADPELHTPSAAPLQGVSRHILGPRAERHGHLLLKLQGVAGLPLRRRPDHGLRDSGHGLCAHAHVRDGLLAAVRPSSNGRADAPRDLVPLWHGKPPPPTPHAPIVCIYPPSCVYIPHRVSISSFMSPPPPSHLIKTTPVHAPDFFIQVLKSFAVRQVDEAAQTCPAPFICRPYGNPEWGFAHFEHLGGALPVVNSVLSLDQMWLHLTRCLLAGIGTVPRLSACLPTLECANHDVRSPGVGTA